MSNTEATLEVACPGPRGPGEAVVEILEPRSVPLGPHQVVQRVLPNRDRRMIGAWCFVDHYGPEDVSNGRGMWLPPHPHSGLQTVSWLLSGEIHHLDSLGNDAAVRPGQLNLMTAGPAIAHSEETPTGSTEPLHGVQLWVALPAPARAIAAAAFAQHPDLPVVEAGGARVRVILGQWGPEVSPARTFTPLLGAEVVIDGAAELSLQSEFEHGVLALDGDVVVEGAAVPRSRICYLGTGRDSVRLLGSGSALLFGGLPFEEQLVMWWNFIGCSHDEIAAMREEWNSPDGGRFGVVRGFDGDRLIAPPMPSVRLRPRSRHR